MSYRSALILLVGVIAVSLMQLFDVNLTATFIVTGIVSACAVFAERQAGHERLEEIFGPAVANCVRSGGLTSAPPARNPSAPDTWSEETIATQRKAVESLKEEVARLTTQLKAERQAADQAADRAMVDPSKLTEAFAHYIHAPRSPNEPGPRPAPTYIGATTNPALAAKYVADGFRADLRPVWLTADGRVASKRGNAIPYLNIIKELQA